MTRSTVGAEHARLTSILALLPRPRSVLDLGCSDGRGAPAYRAVFGAVPVVGIDCDGLALRRAAARGITALCADLTRLPLRGPFDLILVRHPDLDRSAAAWAMAFRAVPGLLAVCGTLLVTTYAAAEIETVQRWLAACDGIVPLTLDEDGLGSVALSGQDRFATAYRRW